MADEHKEALLDCIAQKFRWISRIVAPEAPGFVFFGGELQPADFGLDGYDRPASLSGKGIDAAEAFGACVGEGIEHLSRLEWGNEQIFRGTPRATEHGFDEKSLAEIGRLAGYEANWEDVELDWTPAMRLSEDVPVLVPTDICLRRRTSSVVVPLPSAISTGCAAGPTLEVATLSALLETVERDAVALWWSGGRRGRPFSLNTLARTGAAELLRVLRQGNEARITWLLNITTDIAIPCVAALSATADGHGFACGTAARPGAGKAIRAAMLELCQSELGHHLVAAKRHARGDAALNDVDRRKLERGHSLDARDCQLLHAIGFPEDAATITATDAADAVATAVARVQRGGVEPLLVNLTRPELGIPAVRVIVPGLQPFPSSLKTGRLAAELRKLGPDAAMPTGMSLF
jgi:ribosomal protein S12 methylthiotransferase accessory factor